MKRDENKILYYECRHCGTCIPPNTKSIFTSCKCGKMHIDGTEFYTRIVGNLQEIEKITEIRETFVYRIKQVRTGLFFTPRRGCLPAHFSTVGKFYGKKPSLRWVSLDHGICVIEKYTIRRA